ncbi:MAG: hypothetical protein MO846_08050 [Candidatus Devosia symbiotica]|nr:hypothetical protein [Candidatus Devosia symbiotica]
MIAKLGTALVFTLAAITPLAAESFHHSYGEWHEYQRDWLAVCPDVIDEAAASYYGYSCFASTNSQELNGAHLPVYQLTMIHNRLTGELELAVTVAADDVEADTSRPLIIEFSGAAAMRFDFADDLETHDNTSNQFFVADPARKALLLEHMKQRNALTMTVPLKTDAGGATSKKVWLSMRGVLASLDFMATYARKVAQY